MPELSAALIRRRMDARVAALSDENLRVLLVRSGQRVLQAARTRLVKRGAVDTGFLSHSLGFRISGLDLEVGTHGAPYARLIELGGPFTRTMARAMFAKFGHQGRKPGRNKGYLKAGRFPARPYLVPSAREEARNFKAEVINLLREV